MYTPMNRYTCIIIYPLILADTDTSVFLQFIHAHKQANFVRTYLKVDTHVTCMLYDTIYYIPSGYLT